MKDKVRLKLRDARTGKVLIEQHVGADLFRKTQNWNYLERYLDQEHPSDPASNREIIHDGQTGAVIHSCIEPLREHQGHGSARANPRATRGLRDDR
jgi:hypothetical protein